MRRLNYGAAIVAVMVAGSGLAAEVAPPPGAGLYAGSEIMFFKPFAETGSVPSDILTFTGADDFLPAWRLWGGYLDGDGFGSRVRWWQYDQMSANESGDASRLAFQKLDWEATQVAAFRGWRLLLSGGLTYVTNQLGETLAAGTTPNAFYPLRYRFDGVGLTVGLQASRKSVWHPAIQWCGAVQWSAVYGNGIGTQWGFPGQSSAVSRSIEGTVGSILELSVGPRWERAVGRGAVAFVGGNAEAQVWMTGLGATSTSSTIPYYQRSGDVGLVGLTINMGLRR